MQMITPDFIQRACHRVGMTPDDDVAQMMAESLAGSGYGCSDLKAAWQVAPEKPSRSAENYHRAP